MLAKIENYLDKIIFNTKVLNVTLLEMTECESTNDLMMQFVRSKTEQEGLIVVAKHQKKGRGQRENQWESEKDKNIAMSLCLQPYFLELSEVFYLTIIVSLSLVETLNKIGVEASIKWPNDIYVEDKKISGVLIENILKGAKVVNSVIGVGLNVNQKIFIEPKAVSVCQIIGKEFLLSEVVSNLVHSLDKYYAILKKGERSVLNDLYHRYLYRKDKLSSFDDGEIFEGMIQGVNKAGQLQVLKKDSLVCEYNLKEIKFL